MTAREMQIMFERRLTLMSPQFANSEKPESEVIFTFLNAYTLRFVQQYFLSPDDDNVGTKGRVHAMDILRTLLTSDHLLQHSAIDKSKWSLPVDFMEYCTSRCTISRNTDTGNAIEQTVQPILVTEEQRQHAEANANGLLLPNPYISIAGGAINLTVDKYCNKTSTKDFKLSYYRKPKPFNVFHDGVNVLSSCELPESVHAAIVDGAIEMFISENKFRLTQRNNDRTTKANDETN